MSKTIPNGGENTPTGQSLDVRNRPWEVWNFFIGCYVPWGDQATVVLYCRRIFDGCHRIRLAAFAARYRRLATWTSKGGERKGFEGKK